jgi:hypothetical protein
LAISVVQSYAERHQSRPITPRVVADDNEELAVNELEGVWLDRAALTQVNNLSHGPTPPAVPMHRHRLLSSRPNSSTSNPLQQLQQLNASSARSTPMHATIGTPVHNLTHQHGGSRGSPSIQAAGRNTIERQYENVVEKRVTNPDDCPVCQLLLPQNGHHGSSSGVR